MIFLLIITIIACEDSGEEIEILTDQVVEEEIIEESQLKIAIVYKDQIWSDSLQTQHYQKRLKEKIDNLTAEVEFEVEDLSEEEAIIHHDELYQEITKLREKLRIEAEAEIEETIAEIADEQAFDIVFYKADTRFGGEDITAEVIKRLDQDINDIDKEGYDED